MLLDNYKALANYLNKGKDKSNRPAPKGNNTRIIRINDDCIGVKLHNTFVVKHYKDKQIVLNSGGWRTMTTRERMNAYTDCSISVWQEKFIWYITYNEQTYLYVDNMVFSNDKQDPYLQDKPIKPYTATQKKRKEALKRKIDKYTATFINKLTNQKIPKPNEGDCWYCLLRNTEDNKTMGDCFDYHEHLLSHIDDKYYVPSLLVNAINESNESNDTNYYMLSYMDKQNIAWCFKENGWESYQPYALDITSKRIKTILKRYINKRLGLGIT